MEQAGTGQAAWGKSGNFNSFSFVETLPAVFRSVRQAARPIQNARGMINNAADFMAVGMCRFREQKLNCGRSNCRSHAWLANDVVICQAVCRRTRQLFMVAASDSRYWKLRALYGGPMPATNATIYRSIVEQTPVWRRGFEHCHTFPGGKILRQFFRVFPQCRIKHGLEFGIHASPEFQIIVTYDP